MVFRDESGRLYHIGAKEGEVPPLVLLPGSRVRVRLIAEKLSSPEVIHDGRFLLVRGSWRGVDVAAIDTGIGPSSAAIVVREIVEAIGERDAVLIRPGTCGSLQPGVDPGDLVVSTGSVADEWVSARVAGPRFPLTCDPGVVEALVEAAESRGYRLGETLHVGVTHSKDALYEVEEPPLSARPEEASLNLEYLQRMGVLVTEMELSVISALAAWYNAKRRREGSPGRVRVGGIFLVVSPVKGVEEEVEFRKISQEGLVEVALDALVEAPKRRPRWL